MSLKKISTRVRGIVLMLLLLLPVGLLAQNLQPSDELYLADPNPRLNGPQVEMLQRFLLFHGCDIGPDGMDGWFGRDTEAGLLEYQAYKGLAQTGRIMVQTISQPLTWNPLLENYFLTGMPEGPFPSRSAESRSLAIAHGEDLHYSSYYGSITVSLEEKLQYGYHRLEISPGERFIASQSTKDAHVRVWDLLTGQSITIEAAQGYSESLDTSLHQDYSDPEIEEFFWYIDTLGYRPEIQLVFLVNANHQSWGEYRSTMILFPGRQRRD